MKPLLKSGKVPGAQHLEVHTSYQPKEGALFEVDQNTFDFEVDQNSFDLEVTESR